jgi:two-component system, NtrC family, sensor kinase
MKILSELFLLDMNLDSADFYYKAESTRFFSMKTDTSLLYAKRVQEVQRTEERFQNHILIIGLVTITTIILAASVLLFRSNRLKQKTNLVLQQTLNELKATQSHLIQSEKMASLGELTAGIAHEIQNPLNFVNNFSEVNDELIDDRKKEVVLGNQESILEIANAIKSNQEKINHHGKRADGIVKSMLQHSRSSSGQKEVTDINALCDEHLRLTYHGYRAKDKSFNAKLTTNFDPTIPMINVGRQDIGRVMLNLINNAFYAVREKVKSSPYEFEPTVLVSTKRLNDTIEIWVQDNGGGIPEDVSGKIFQPFFTTKPTGQGTGLGLSLSYDIVKAHAGELSKGTNDAEGTTFLVKLPI